MQQIATKPLHLSKQLHRDQRGAMSIVSVFTIILLGFLLGMVLNVCKQADSKVRMQNAADAATYASGIVTARGMNSLAFTNHLLCDVFALTAFLREGGEDVNQGSGDSGPQNKAEKMTEDILLAWQETAPELSDNAFGSFGNWNGNYVTLPGNLTPPELGNAILAIIEPQSTMIEKYSAWARAFSAEVLPTLETILNDELIPQYQQALVEAAPEMAQDAAREVAQRHGYDSDGEPNSDRGQMAAALWNSDATPFRHNGPDDPNAGLPVVDPLQNPSSFYLDTAREQRKRLAEGYLSDWNTEKLEKFAEIGLMSRFRELWIGFTQGQLEKLLSENQDKNLLHVIWTPSDVQASDDSEDLRPTISFNWSWQQRNDFLEQQYMFVGAVYWKPARHFVPGLFENPIAGDRVNGAQGMLFLPVPRLHHGVVDCYKVNRNERTGELLDPECILADDNFADITRTPWPIEWNLLNQNWHFKLVPTMMPELATILSQPYGDFAPADISGLTYQEVFDINTH